MGGVIVISRTRLSQQSDKRRAQQGEYDRARQAAFDRDKGQCQAGAKIPELDGCYGRRDPHHVRPRGRGGAYADVDNLLTCCRACHDWIHAHPIEAAERGLLK